MIDKKYKTHNMKKVLLLIICLQLLFVIAFSQKRVHVRGYYRKSGAYVSPYTHTSPDNTITNNYSYPGNYNPNTGCFTTISQRIVF